MGYGNGGRYFHAPYIQAARGEACFPVPAQEAMATLVVLDAARTSALETRVVTVG